ncbi:hypothetical protein Tco_1083593, partial [Tanacetum coccineum]
LGKSKEVGTLRYLSLVVPLKRVGDEAVYKELGDRMERAATIASSLEAEQDSGSGLRIGVDTARHKLNTASIKYALTESPTIYGDMEITATIDGKVKVVSEASIRRHLKLEASDELPKDILGWTLYIAPSTSQPPTSPPSMQTTQVAEEAATMPHDSPLLRVHSLRSDEGSMTLNELMGRHEHDFKESDFEFIVPEEDYTAEPDISTANVPVSTAATKVSTASPEVKTAAEKERQRIARVHEKASIFNAEEWDNIQAQIEADEELAHRLQAQERERYSKADKERLLRHIINERKRKFA